MICYVNLGMIESITLEQIYCIDSLINMYGLTEIKLKNCCDYNYIVSLALGLFYFVVVNMRAILICKTSHQISMD